MSILSDVCLQGPITPPTSSEAILGHVVISILLGRLLRLSAY